MCGRLDSYLAGLNRDLASRAEQVDALFAAQSMQEQTELFHRFASKEVEQAVGYG